MADFCKECSVELFGRDFEDLKGLISKEEVDAGFGSVVICEGCGGRLVDHEGKCIDLRCEEHGAEQCRPARSRETN